MEKLSFDFGSEGTYNKVRKYEYHGKIYVAKKGREIFEILKEIIYYKNLDSPYIPKIKHVLTNNEGTFEFLIDLYNGDVDEIIFDPANFKTFITQMLLALHQVHSKGIFNSDVKPKNILYSGDNYYLIDFGLAEFYGFPQEKLPYDCTEITKAPHIIINDNFNIDVFSLGISAYKVLTEEYLLKDYIKNFDDFGNEIVKNLTLNQILKYDNQKIEKLIGKDGSILLYNMLGLNGKYISTTEALNSSYLNIKVDLYENEAFKIFHDVKIFISNQNENDYTNLINWVINVFLTYNINNNALMGTNTLIRKLFHSKLNINSENIILYTIASLIINKSIYNDDSFFIEEHAVYVSGKTLKELQDAVINIMNEFDMKIDLIPYKLYLDYYIKNSTLKDKYDSAMKISEVLLMHLLLYNNNDRKETLNEISNKIIEITFAYLNQKNISDLYLYTDTKHILEFFNIININNYSSINILKTFMET